MKSKTFASEVKNIDLRSKENELQEVKTLYPNYIDNNKSEDKEKPKVKQESSKETER